MTKEIIGVNEAANVPQHPEIRINDLVKQSRGWRGNRLHLNAGAGFSYPLGQYMVMWEGNTDVVLRSGAGAIVPIKNSKSGLTNVSSFDVKSHSPVGLYLEHSGDEPISVNAWATLSGESYSRGFISDLSRFDVWRTMDLSKTNGSQQKFWDDRPVESSPAGKWFEDGWSWEAQISAANQAEVDLWICVPHMANDEYVENLAALCAEQLRPERKLYVEYTNEHWNFGPAFEQSRWIRSQSGKSSSSVWYGMRSAQVWGVFEKHLSRNRLQRVLAGQATAPRVMEQALRGVQFQREAAVVDSGYKQWPDVLSIAAYFNPGRKGLYDRFSQLGLDLPGVDFPIAYKLIKASIDGRIPYWKLHAEMADANGCKLIAYEAGSHVSAAAGEERNDATYVAWLHDVNRHPMMHEAYKLLRDSWRDAGGNGMLYFQRLAGPTKFGSWGHKESANDSNSPKWHAVLQHLEESKVRDQPTLDTIPKVIVELPDGGLGNVEGWQGKASLYTGSNALRIKLDEPLRFPKTVMAVFARLDMEAPVQMCELVGMRQDKPGSRLDTFYPFAACDAGEHQKPNGSALSSRLRAVRGRHVTRLEDGETIAVPNGSTPGVAGIGFTRGCYHHGAWVFNSEGEHPQIIEAYIDDNPETFQSSDPRNKPGQAIPTDFDLLEIGNCNRNGDRIVLSHVIIIDGIVPFEQIAARARSLGLPYRDSLGELENDGRVYFEQPLDDTQPPPVQTGTYERAVTTDGNEIIRLMPN